ncbi:S8 family peptidase [Brevibacillus borstelensis]|uniref:S8 family peptidase n=1 Tax=Brevibacillus borstelensis TaxID=45462 RepID=UPI0030BA8BA7
MEWLVSQGVKIINCSIAYELENLAVRAAMEEAYKKHGVLFVCSAGNNREKDINPNDSVVYPAKYDFVMAVSCLKSSKEPANYSSRGPEVDIAAPAHGVMTTNRSIENSNGNYYHVSSSYRSFNGTSCAAPHITGLAALLWGMEPSLSADDIRTTIQMSAEDLGKDGKDPDYGYGMAKSPWTKVLNYPGKLTSNAIHFLGNSISDTLTEGLGKHFKFVPSETATYVFTVTSQLDTYMRLYDSNYKQLAQDDNSGGGILS